MTPKLSQELATTLRKNSDIKPDSQLHEALWFLASSDVNDNLIDELEDMIVAYSPDTTVGELNHIASKEDAKPFGIKDLINWMLLR